MLVSILSTVVVDAGTNDVLVGELYPFITRLQKALSVHTASMSATFLSCHYLSPRNYCNCEIALKVCACDQPHY